MRQCLARGCGTPIPSHRRVRRCRRHEAELQRERNANPERVALYGGDWPAESRAIRAAQPWCSVALCARQDLTVDHPTRSVLCVSHHMQLENRRRRVPA